ncbi:MAG: mannose-1-phosphate guanylyltransferase [Fidelibacterota bacterium]
MAGGSGTRFWPYSRKQRPKQLLNIIGDHSMLQMTVDRFAKMKFIKDIYIVTRADLAETIAAEVTGINPENIIIEPEGKNTAPCIGLAALILKSRAENAIMGVFPADHLIVGHKAFENAVRTAFHLAKKNHSLVTIGITPTYAATGYGYVQYLPESDMDHLDAYHVKTFAEKPHKALAERFLASGDFLWNGGMFIWQVDTLFDALKTYMPDLYTSLTAIEKRLAEKKAFHDIWAKISPESIDYGLMEKIKSHLYVVKAKFRWSDLGSWASVYNQLIRKGAANVVQGPGLVLEGKGNLVHSADRFTAVVGVDNVVVVNTEDATLVIPREKVEDVRLVVEWLRSEGKEELL